MAKPEKIKNKNGNALFSAGGQAAFAGQMLSSLMMAYTIVMIVVMIIQIVWGMGPK